MTVETAYAALAAWGMTEANIALVAQRENIVFRVRNNGADYALRLHRPGYQTVQMMRSELVWMQHLGAQGLPVPAPLPGVDGTFLQEVDGLYADLLTWLDGKPLGATGTPLDLPDRTGTFFKVGQLMAQVHRISDDWELPPDFERNRWDLDGLLGETPLWDRFWDNPGLLPTDRTRILEARRRLRQDLTATRLDFGLIHADMLRENVMIDGERLGLIDFDDSGFGYRLFDVATTLCKNMSEPDYQDLKASLLDGYRSVRALDTTLLPQFILIRSLSYLGWIIARADEPGSDVRQARFLASALPLTDRYLASDR